MEENIEQTVKVSISTVLSIPIEDILLEDNLKEDLAADSLDEVRIAMELEERLDINFPDYEFDKVEYVSDLVKLTAMIKGVSYGG
jgi:acyl carrier protein